MFIMNAAVGVSGIPWATPISDVLAMLAALVLFFPYWKKVNAKIKEEQSLQINTNIRIEDKK